MKNAILTLALACLVSTNVRAADDQYMAYGPGFSTSCGAFNAALKQHGPNVLYRDRNGQTTATMTAYYMSWVSGYLSSSNADKPRSQQIDSDTEGLAGWLKNYCEANPMQTLGQATNALSNAKVDSAAAWDNLARKFAAPTPNPFDQFDPKPSR